MTASDMLSPRRRQLCVTMVALVVAFAEPEARALGFPQVAVTNCARDTTGSLRVEIQRASRADKDEKVVRVWLHCRGGAALNIGFGGVGYRVDSGRLVPDPNYNPGCPEYCWPPIEMSRRRAGHWVFEARFDVNPEKGPLTIKPSIQGTDVPTWDELHLGIDLVGGHLPDTGSGFRWLAACIAMGLVAAAAGGTLVWAAQKRRLNSLDRL